MLSADTIWCLICSKYNFADGMRQMFDPFERVARAHHICPCCERPFSPEEEDEFVKKVGMNHHSYLSRLCISYFKFVMYLGELANIYL